MSPCSLKHCLIACAACSRVLRSKLLPHTPSARLIAMARTMPSDVFNNILSFKDPRYENARAGIKTASAQALSGYFVGYPFVAYIAMPLSYSSRVCNESSGVLGGEITYAGYCGGRVLFVDRRQADADYMWVPHPSWDDLRTDPSPDDEHCGRTQTCLLTTFAGVRWGDM